MRNPEDIDCLGSIADHISLPDVGTHYLSLVIDAYSRKIMGHDAFPKHDGGRCRACAKTGEHWTA